MIEEHQTQAEPGQSCDPRGEEKQPQPGLFGAERPGSGDSCCWACPGRTGPIFLSLPVSGASDAKGAQGVFSGAWRFSLGASLPCKRGHCATKNQHITLFLVSALPFSRASKSSPVFQISPAPRVRTRSPSRKCSRIISATAPFSSTKWTAGWPLCRMPSQMARPETPCQGFLAGRVNLRDKNQPGPGKDREELRQQGRGAAVAVRLEGHHQPALRGRPGPGPSGWRRSRWGDGRSRPAP